MSEQAYYEDSTRWGEYQYVLLSQIIDDLMANMADDSYISSAPRHRVLYHAKRGIRDLYFDVMNEIKAIELDLSPTMKVVLPTDFVNYVRISFVDDQGVLHPMAEDRSMSIANAYLQDNNFELLYDNNGNVLTGTGKRNSQDLPSVDDANYVRGYLFNNSYVSSFTPNVDRSRIFPNGRFRFDRQNGVIEFGSEVNGASIVLEYISDGLYSNGDDQTEAGIKVHKFAEETLRTYTYWSMIKTSRNAPANEKARAKDDYNNNRRLSKRRINTLRMEDLKQVMKGDSVWIKNGSTN